MTRCGWVTGWTLVWEGFSSHSDSGILVQVQRNLRHRLGLLLDVSACAEERVAVSTAALEHVSET